MSAPLKIESGSGLIEYLRGSAFVGLCLSYVQRGLFQLTLQLAASGDNPATEFGQFARAFAQEQFNFRAPLGDL